jgi:hypothetical protein
VKKKPRAPVIYYGTRTHSYGLLLLILLWE